MYTSSLLFIMNMYRFSKKSIRICMSYDFIHLYRSQNKTSLLFLLFKLFTCATGSPFQHKLFKLSIKSLLYSLFLFFFKDNIKIMRLKMGLGNPEITIVYHTFQSTCIVIFIVQRKVLRSPWSSDFSSSRLMF